MRRLRGIQAEVANGDGVVSRLALALKTDVARLDCIGDKRKAKGQPSAGLVRQPRSGFQQMRNRGGVRVFMCETSTHFWRPWSWLCIKNNTSSSGEGLGDVALSQSFDEVVTKAEAMPFSLVVHMSYGESNRPSQRLGAGQSIAMAGCEAAYLAQVNEPRVVAAGIVPEH